MGRRLGRCCRIGRRGVAHVEVTGVYSMASFGSCARIRYPWQMRNQNQNLGGSRARRWFGYLGHEWIGERWRPIAPAFARPNPAKWSGNRITAAWLGHATVLINFFGIKILTDPVLFPRIGVRLPGLTVGPKRLTASALTVRDPDLLRWTRFRDVSELRWKERKSVTTSAGKIDITAFRVKHWGARKQRDIYRGYNGYVFERNNRRNAARWRQIFREGIAVREVGMRAKDLQAPGSMGGDELFQKQPAEQPREHAHRQEEARPAGYPPLAVQGNAPARNHLVD